mmetsp:Transcript_5794/g.18612  ORF Transcript_5794/g.18612 Transcript_5794/m.18612 type:complete len:236 (+) Transcript_5794:1505-2212(+)
MDQGGPGRAKRQRELDAPVMASAHGLLRGLGHEPAGRPHCASRGAPRDLLDRPHLCGRSTAVGSGHFGQAQAAAAHVAFRPRMRAMVRCRQQAVGPRGGAALGRSPRGALRPVPLCPGRLPLGAGHNAPECQPVRADAGHRHRGPCACSVARSDGPTDRRAVLGHGGSPSRGLGGWHRAVPQGTPARHRQRTTAPRPEPQTNPRLVERGIPSPLPATERNHFRSLARPARGSPER